MLDTETLLDDRKFAETMLLKKDKEGLRTGELWDAVTLDICLDGRTWINTRLITNSFQEVVKVWKGNS